MVWNANPVFSSALDQAESLFEEVGLKLEERGHVWQDVVLVYLYLADMTSYKVVNAVYAKYFPVNPPARYNGNQSALHDQEKQITKYLVLEMLLMWQNEAIPVIRTPHLVPGIQPVPLSPDHECNVVLYFISETVLHEKCNTDSVAYLTIIIIFV